MSKPIRYFVLFACRALSAKELNTATLALKRSIGLPGPHGVPWRQSASYITDCAILTLEGWNQHMASRIPVVRLSEHPAYASVVRPA